MYADAHSNITRKIRENYQLNEKKNSVICWYARLTLFLRFLCFVLCRRQHRHNRLVENDIGKYIRQPAFLSLLIL